MVFGISELALQLRKNRRKKSELICRKEGAFMNQGIIAILILAVLIVFYATRILPASVTAMLGVIASVIFGLTTVAEASVQYASDIVMIFAGIAVLGEALFKVGLADDIGGLVAKIFSGNEKSFLIFVSIASAAISSFISNASTVAIMIPIAASTAALSNGRIKNKHLYMAIGMGAVLGGNMTMFASTPQIAVQGILLESSVQGARAIGVFEMAKGAVGLALLIPLYFLCGGYRFEKKVLADLEETEQKKDDTSGEKPLGRKIVVGAIFLLCIVSFVGSWITMGQTAVLGALLCVLTGCMTEKEALKSIDWSTCLMMGGFLAFSDAFSNSGAGNLIVDFAIRLLGGDSASPFSLYALLIVIAVLLTSVMSNTAVAAMLAPIGLAAAERFGVNPITFAIGIIFAASISFATPIATPPVTMTSICGYRFSDYFKIGGLFTIFGTLYVVFAIPLLYGL